MESKEDVKKLVNRKLIVIAAAIAAVVCIALAAVIFAKGGSVEKRLAEQLDLAERYLSELDYEQAIVAYQAAIEIDPKCEEAYLGLADIYIEQGEYESAIEILEAGLAQTDSEAIRSKLEEVEELLAERERQAQETLASVDDVSDMPAEEEAATANRVPYADEMAAIATASVGDIVYFGSYKQDNDMTNGTTEPVEWYVLDKADGEATLLAVYLLDHQQYHEEWEDITWEDCTLRSWLNGTFYNTAFSAEEQAVIVNTNVINADNPYFGTEGGSDTTDKVWLLSQGEVEKYFHIDTDVYNDYNNGNMEFYEYAIYCYRQDNRVCAKPTAYAAAKGGAVTAVTYSEGVQYALDNSGYDMSYGIGNNDWWLRSPGECSDIAALVLYDGSVGINRGVYNHDGVRPALKVAY